MDNFNETQFLNQQNEQWYQKTWLVILLCIVFFPVGIYALWKNTKLNTAIKLVISVIIGILVMSMIAGGADTSTTPEDILSGNVNSENNSNESNSKKWTTIITLKGNGSKKSQIFELVGDNAKIVYKYKGTPGIGVGMFAAYVVEEGVQIMKDGGIPDVISSLEKDNGESFLHKSSGKYYLEVNAAGSWDVSIQEEK